MIGVLLDGRYRITGRIGAGGMGTVWEAEDERLGRNVAVKTLTGLPGEYSKELQERFQREARLAAGLSSRHVVTIHDYGRTQVDHRVVLYLVMERLRGRPMSEIVADDGPLPLHDIARWGRDICQALQAAHRAGVVHRDLKPSNVLIDEDGSAVVLDFGIARFLGDATELTRLTRTGAAIGTPAYMSPEQALGADDIDKRTDMYSLGCLLYELLTGRPPFANGLAHVVLRMHIEDPPTPPSAHRPDLPAAWDRLLLNLLAKRPHDRIPDASIVRDRLAALPSPETTTRHATAARTPQPTRKVTTLQTPRSTAAQTTILILAPAAGLALPLLWRQTPILDQVFGPYFRIFGKFNLIAFTLLMTLTLIAVLLPAALKARPTSGNGRISLAVFYSFTLGFEISALVEALSHRFTVDVPFFGDAPYLPGALRMMLTLAVPAAITLSIKAILAPRERYPADPGPLATTAKLADWCIGGLAFGATAWVDAWWDWLDSDPVDIIANYAFLTTVVIGYALTTSLLTRRWSISPRQ
ncbi:serine/threonine-protein kinase [Streptomyces sp. NRRL F-2890]|uniref:serine/threonine-protein kinase n=1 Tax=Streptomyces sp. NRRL F-2890 TaxID=1463845 RepID=UPI0006937D78|nr:serine/threonine-protein kinase [Streptomyces sp. NRRL F-2890]